MKPFPRRLYLNPNTGRFHTMDTFEGVRTDPQSLHKYLYAHGNPVMGIDPSGEFPTSLSELAVASAITGVLAAVFNSVLQKYEVNNGTKEKLDYLAAIGIGFSVAGGTFVAGLLPLVSGYTVAAAFAEGGALAAYSLGGAHALVGYMNGYLPVNFVYQLIKAEIGESNED